jgi:hypothetical protein
VVSLKVEKTNLPIDLTFRGKMERLDYKNTIFGLLVLMSLLNNYSNL